MRLHLPSARIVELAARKGLLVSGEGGGRVHDVRPGVHLHVRPRTGEGHDHVRLPVPVEVRGRHVVPVQ